MTFYKWSQVAAADATADSSINWQEGQAPSSVNDSARAMMAALAKHRDDIGGPLTSNIGNALSVSTYQQFDTLGHLANQLISFRSNNTNTGASTLSIDGLGAKPLRLAPNVETPAGTILSGVPYTVVYNLGDDCFYFFNFFGNPYNVPIGGGMDYWGTTTPNSSFAFPTGQAISRTVYSALFAIMGTAYGSGDGTTTFNLPDKTGRVSAMKEGSATRLTSSYFGGNSTVIGATGGLENHTLTTAQLAAHTHNNSLTDPGHNHSGNIGGANINVTSSGAALVMQPGGSVGSNTTGITITNASAGSGNAHNNVQPTIICNYIIRII
ncbi:tail fiber protein [Bradyrhizobium jicamae]|uniref:phage tail protein n=1 Tax=Bradyrhizobium jicamae TaxID=280332 RepID=UPI001BA5D8CA|nr:tail fiber protein [Bradyrhizobium jicamae]MBR0756612.1 tail fiber protein [Bradyrhizobium jicamae]